MSDAVLALIIALFGTPIFGWLFLWRPFRHKQFETRFGILARNERPIGYWSFWSFWFALFCVSVFGTIVIMIGFAERIAIYLG